MDFTRLTLGTKLGLPVGERRFDEGWAGLLGVGLGELGAGLLGCRLVARLYRVM